MIIIGHWLKVERISVHLEEYLQGFQYYFYVKKGNSCEKNDEQQIQQDVYFEMSWIIILL